MNQTEESDVSAQKPEMTITEEEKMDIDQNKSIAALAYLIFFLPLVVKPDSKFGRFHANQALLIFILGIGVSLIGPIIPFIGSMVVVPLGSVFALVLFIMGIINAANGKKVRLPLIGDIDIIK